MTFYAEQTGPDGTWRPVLLADAPEMKGDRIKRTNGGGARLRRIGSDQHPYCIPVPLDYASLSLDALHAVLSPDGRFTAGQAGADNLNG